jgi:hypothetical protein
MINKDENISVGVYWDDIGIPGWKLPGWLKRRATVSSKNCKSTLRVAQYLCSYQDMWTDIGCCVLLCMPVQKRLQKS